MQQVCGKMSEVLKQKIRRDLSRWSRKLLLCIGLEDIGKELVGEEEWKRLYPLSPDGEQDRTSDFDPTEVPHYFDISDLPHIDPSETPEEETNEEKNDFLENFFHLLPYWYFINRAFGVPGSGTINTSEDLSNRNPFSDTFDAQRLNCLLFLQSLKQQHLQVQSNVADGSESEHPLNNNNIQNLTFPSTECIDDGDSRATRTAATRFPVDNDFIRTLPFQLPGLSFSYSSQDLDQPLDLTQKTTHLSHSDDTLYHFKQKTSEISDNSVIDNKSSQSKPSKTTTTRGQRSGRGYTTQELESALKDIQSGKLGTRRAAVIYGIPRSTLRNKVYKLGKDRSRSYFRPRPENKRTYTNEQNLSDPKSELSEALISDSLSAKLVSNSDFNPKLSSISTNSPFPSSHSQGCFNRGLDDEQEIEDSKLELGDISHEKKVLKEWLRTKLNRQSLTQINSENECLTDGIRRSLSIRKHAPSDNSDSDGSKEDLRQDIILKIPSLSNNKSSLSRLISKQKLKRRHENEDESDSAYVLSLPRRTFSPASTSTKAGSDGQTQKASFGDSMDESEVESAAGIVSKETNSDTLSYRSATTPARSYGTPSSECNGKKSRPKRGKYRNYDRDALLKAVRAVQNGEMSVHRAGSFYGVPHSTLEYKVKERHLLRRTKKETGPKCTQKSSPETSLSGSDILSTHHLSNAVSRSSVSLIDSRHLPLPSDFRETLSRYLNIDQPFRLQSHSAPLSPDSSVKLHSLANKTLTDGNRQPGGVDEDQRDLEIGYSSSILNTFQIANHSRQNLDILLDLSKKSE